MTYQVAHDDLGSANSRSISVGCSSLSCWGPSPGALLDSSDWGFGDSSIGWSSTASTTSCSVLAGAEDLIQRLIEFSRHFDRM